MNYKEAMEYIEFLQVFGSVPGLDNMINLCGKLGNPQDKLSFLHIAGTNGKGSVSAYLSAVLKEAGYRVGTYNSPTMGPFIWQWLPTMIAGSSGRFSTPTARIFG